MLELLLMDSFIFVVLIFIGIAFVLCFWVMVMLEVFIVCAKGWVASGCGCYGIVLFRFVFGIVLFLAVLESKQFFVFQIFGVLAFIKGLMILFMLIDKAIVYIEKFMKKF